MSSLLNDKKQFGPFEIDQLEWSDGNSIGLYSDTHEIDPQCS